MACQPHSTIAHNAYNNTRIKNQCPQIVTYPNHKTPTMHHPQMHPILLCNLNAHEPMMRIDYKKAGNDTNNYKIHHSAYTQSKAQPKHEITTWVKSITYTDKANIIHTGARKQLNTRTNAHDKTHTRINTIKDHRCQ